MSKSKVNFWLDATMAFLFALFLALAAIVSVVFPSGLQAKGWQLWGYHYDHWCMIRDSALVMFALAVLVHLILHWNWICGYLTTRIARQRGSKILITDGEKTIYGVGTLVLFMTLIACAIAAAEFSIQPPKTERINAGQTATTGRR